MRKPTPSARPDRDHAPNGIPPYGDWVTWAIMLLGAMIVLVATSELWMWHPWR